MNSTNCAADRLVAHFGLINDLFWLVFASGLLIFDQTTLAATKLLNTRLARRSADFEQGLGVIRSFFRPINLFWMRCLVPKMRGGWLVLDRRRAVLKLAVTDIFWQKLPSANPAQ